MQIVLALFVQVEVSSSPTTNKILRQSFQVIFHQDDDAFPYFYCVYQRFMSVKLFKQLVLISMARLDGSGSWEQSRPPLRGGMQPLCRICTSPQTLEQLDQLTQGSHWPSTGRKAGENNILVSNIIWRSIFNYTYLFYDKLLTWACSVEALLPLNVLSPTMTQRVSRRAVSLSAHGACPTGGAAGAPGTPGAPSPTALLICGASECG